MTPAERAAPDAREREIDDLLAPLNDLLVPLDDTDDEQPASKPEHIEPEPGPELEPERDPLDAMLADLYEWTPSTVDPDPGIETPLVTEPHPIEQPEWGVEVTLDDLDPDEVAEVKAMLEAPGLADEEKAEIDALLGELDIIDETSIAEPAEATVQPDIDIAPASFPQPSTAPETGAKSSANFPQKRRRRSQSRDREAVEITRDCGFTPVSAKAGDFSIDTPTPFSHPLSTDSLTPSVARPIHAWGDTGDVAKIITANHSLADLGTPYEVTANLGPDVIAMGRASKMGFDNYITDRLQKAFRKIGCNEVVLVIDDKEGLPHVHAGISLDPDLSAKGLAAKKAILEEAAGEWGNPKGKQFHVKLVPQRNLDHYADYMIRKIPHARKAIQGNPVYISNPLRKLAKQRWEHNRAIINEQFRAPSARRASSPRVSSSSRLSAPSRSSSPAPSPAPRGLILFVASSVDHSAHASPVAPARIQPVVPTAPENVLPPTGYGHVHVHGGVALDAHQENAARAILHKAGGKWGAASTTRSVRSCSGGSPTLTAGSIATASGRSPGLATSSARLPSTSPGLCARPRRPTTGAIVPPSTASRNQPRRHLHHRHVHHHRHLHHHRRHCRRRASSCSRRLVSTTAITVALGARNRSGAAEGVTPFLGLLCGLEQV